MSTPLPDEEESVDTDYPYCEAVPGMSSHNYQPAIDLGGTGMYLICNQCGDYFHVEGTGIQSGAAPTATTPAPAAPSSGTGTPTPSRGSSIFP